jgi:CheY-like chemotaxis protein
LEVTERPDGSRLDFSVQDTGIGIAPENLPKLFKSFQQIDSALNRKYAGTGLGLALVKRMTEMHGGEVSVVSEPGRGARFTVSIPASPGAVKAAGLERGPSKTPFRPEKIPGAPLILIAEDHPTNRLLLERHLSNRGCRLIFAMDGQEAVARATADRPALILMDVQMPVLDGLEATRRLRADPATAAIPIITLTALAMPEDRLRCLEAGANAYLSKPLQLAELDRLILEHLPPA